MLEIKVPGSENWDEVNECFVVVEPCTLQLEHSLISLAKWESKWHKCFMNKFVEKTEEETIDYIRCMTLNKHVNPAVYLNLTREHVKDITDYIQDPMTAATFKDKDKPSNELVTADIIYYSMVALQIPFECEKWHLNRLLALIHVCNIKNKPSKKMSPKSILSSNASLNAARRAKLGTKG